MTKKILYKSGEVLGLIGGVWYLLSGNFTGVVAGAAVAFVSHILSSRRS